MEGKAEGGRAKDRRQGKGKRRIGRGGGV